MAGYLISGLLILVTCSWRVDAITREYYVAIQEVAWDYAPSGRNLMKNISLEDDEDASVFTRRGETTIGRVYKKAIFLEYTDDTFTVQSPREEHWGIIGPPIKAEKGDKLIVHVKNMASRRFSLHPHGLFYNKTHEAALYFDKSLPEEKVGDAIAPGTTFVYHWNVTSSFAPTEDDPDCLTWIYHSHTDAVKDTNAGLAGPIVICRPGILDAMGNRNDIDKELYFLFTVFDENESWYLEENIQNYCTNPSDVDAADDDFQESNKMHGINGLLYGNLQGISMCKGERVVIHMLGLGTEVDLHSIHFHGQTVITQGHRQDTINIFPGVFATAQLTPDNPGTFELSCSVNDHITAGMLTRFTVDECRGSEQDSDDILSGNIRKFFIGIREEDWNYGPSGRNLMTQESLIADGSDSKAFFEKASDRIGGIYKKAIFYEYASDLFESNMAKPSSFGILGPLIAVEVGDTVRITLKNFAEEQAYNIEPHGVFFSDLTPVEAGEMRTYEWKVPESVSPTRADSDCVAYIYTSSVDPVADTNAGLVGPLLVCKRDTLKANLQRRSLYVLFTVFDENSSHYIKDNVRRFISDPTTLDMDDETFVESNLMHSINGLMYGNLDIDFCRYMETDIHVMAIGNEVDMHSFYLDGLSYTFRNEYTNVLSVFPHTTASTTITPTELGHGQLNCQVNDHLEGGMLTNFSVEDCGIEPVASYHMATDGATRTYYVAAVDEIWDYCPWKEKIVDHDLTAFTAREKGKLIGSKYWKAIYYEYTDETFTTRKTKPLHFGVLGPVIKGEEGDKIKVVFRNMARRAYSIHPWGLYPEGFLEEGTAEANPGETVTYIWEIPKEAVPTENQPICNAHTYISNVDVVKDVYTGLFGPILICRKGGLAENGWMEGADEEFFLTFIVFDETSSHYLDQNIREFAEADPEDFDKEDEEFLENNLLHATNGRIGFLEGLDMYDGDRVIWHLQGIGNEVDIHTIHFHAHAYMYTSDLTTHGDVFNLFPGKAGTVDMTVNSVGRWLLHCHVNDHVAAGTTTTYNVMPKSEKMMQKHPCYARKRWPRKHELYCSFESPLELEDLIHSATDNYEVCAYKRSSKDVGYRCQTSEILTPRYVFKLVVSTNFYMEPGSFRHMMALFPGLRLVSVNYVGLRYLEPETFSSNTRLRRISLRGNKLNDISPGLFTTSRSLKHVDLRNNELRENWTGPPAVKFLGLPSESSRQ